MTLAEMHTRLDQIESALDQAIEAEKFESTQRVNRLRAIKNKASSMRVAMAVGREVITSDLKGLANSGEAA